MTTTTEVPKPYPVGIQGRGYLVDTKSGDWRHVTIPQIRPQADTGDEVGAQSLNPEGLWIRDQESWDFGAGQAYLDKPDSNRSRFRYSLGIDPWTKGELSLLKATDQKKTLADTGYLLVVGSYLYLYDYDANKLYYTQSITPDSPTWTEVTGLSATKGLSIATDGYNVYIAQGANGIYSTTRGAASASSWVTGTVNYVGYVKGRLMAAANNSLYNVTAAGALPAALLTHGNTDADWISFAEGTNNIYIGLSSGSKSQIYRTSIKADGTALDIPIVAGELPDGEQITSLHGYLGYIFIGTTLGVRFATANGDGDLTIGAVIELSDGTEADKYVYAFEPQGQYVWFSWGNFTGSWTGLGRVNLQNFTDTEGLVPAYASDLMAQTQGAVTSIVTFQDRRVFVVDDVGVYGEEATYVANGVLDTGRITFGVSNQKLPRFLDIRPKPSITNTVQGTITGWLLNDRALGLSVGSYSGTVSPDQLTVSSVVRDDFVDEGATIEIELVLAPGSSNTTTPTVSRWTLKAEAIAPVGVFIYVPLLINETDDIGYPEHRDVADELSTLSTYRTDRTVIDYQEGNTTYAVTVDDFEWRPDALSTQGYAEGTILLKLKLAQ